MTFRNLIDQQKNRLDYFFSHLSALDAEKMLTIVQDTEGLIFFSGVGKSGNIASKLADTFLSLGKRAFFLDPLKAVHGDLGAICEKDLLIMLSKSGETKELLHLIPYVKEKKAKICAWVCRKGSKLENKADFSLYLPMEKELCPFDLVPTTSAAIQLMFGDLLAVALMQQKKFTLEEYAKNHPSGSIGKKISYTVEDLMLKEKNLPLCSKKDLLKDILVDFSEKKCGCIIVVDEKNQVEGIFTDGDLRRALQKESSEVLKASMQQLMNKNFIYTSKSQKLQKALELMQTDAKKWVSALPVLEDNKIIGLLRMHDIIHFSN